MSKRFPLYLRFALVFVISLSFVLLFAPQSDAGGWCTLYRARGL